MHVVDSSGWIEYFSGAAKADKYEPYVCAIDKLIVPSLVVFEVYKYIKSKLGEESAIYAVTQMQRGQIVSLDDELALFAADLALHHKLGMADAIIYATASRHHAKLITSDNDFRDLPQTLIL